MQRYKVQKLLNNNLSELDFLDRLTITEEEKNDLMEYRKDVRECLRKGFRALANQAKISGVNLDVIASLEPKFWTQGSFSYNTLNDPAHNPPQQIDLDDGVYFPMELVSGKPVAVKNALLKSVSGMLEVLAREKSWTLSKKSTCARLTINQRVHLDIPVYAIPRERYAVMAKAISESRHFGSQLDQSSIRLDPNEIYLALWDDGEHWVQSDPKELEKWFKKEVAMHGQRLRRLCRYMKAWRDYSWEKGGPSSIALMAAVAEIFDNHLGGLSEPFNTDCQALLAVAERLPELFSAKIMNPVGESELFPNGLGGDTVWEIRAAVEQFSNQITTALCSPANDHEVVEVLQGVFGDRIPSKPHWVERLSIAEVVKSVPVLPQVQPKPSQSHRSA
ncbi:CBASS cGAMP synthase [Microbulbifer sp. JMSA003]|uniref:CBASS cGAMP synthase n=1 Tax=Microbulbifer sp. JMSA003 TaxID=3243369 RepID=UPI0040395403